MKKLFAVILSLVLILAMTGCMQGEDRIVINEDGSGESYSKIMMDKSVSDQLTESFGMSLEDMGLEDARVETVDGVEYYVTEATVGFGNFAELISGLEESGYSGIYAGDGGLRYVFDAGVSKEDLEQMEAMGFDLGDSVKAGVSITMPKEILATTGTLSEDKKTATFIFEGNDFYTVQDVMASIEKETVKPVLSGITNKKTYSGAKTVTAKDASGIKTAKYKKNDGKYYSFDINKTFTQNGKYTVYATDYYGNKTTKTFTIKDTTKPTVSGVTSGKTYSSEREITFKDNCGVKTAKLYCNGKRVSLSDDEIANGFYLADTGSYKITVTDVNGNSRTVTFKIK